MLRTSKTNVDVVLRRGVGVWSTCQIPCSGRFAGSWGDLPQTSFSLHHILSVTEVGGCTHVVVHYQKYIFDADADDAVFATSMYVITREIF